MLTYDIRNLPDDLPSGRYHTRVLSARWTASGVYVELEYKEDQSEPGLFPFTVDKP